jgi:hypothetical protein
MPACRGAFPPAARLAVGPWAAASLVPSPPITSTPRGGQHHFVPKGSRRPCGVRCVAGVVCGVVVTARGTRHVSVPVASGMANVSWLLG